MKAPYLKPSVPIVFQDAIKSTDLYFYELGQKWVQVPRHWVGDRPSFHPDFKIKKS